VTPGPYCAVYDFELMPYALGDVLTWNIQTAIHCEEQGRTSVDVFICADERHPVSLYQQGVVTPENCGLFVDELSGAFGTHPKLGNIFIYRSRGELLDRLRTVARGDPVNEKVLAGYEQVLASRANDDAVIAHFIKSLQSHRQINEFWNRHGDMPRLRSSIGCDSEVDDLFATPFAGKHVVAIHMRLRRLDSGLGGERTYARDSAFLGWYEFLRKAGRMRPDVQFVTLGRLQEKPLELLKLPNVTSLRLLGLSLGHELSLVLRNDLFIGTSSGFAAMAYFSQAPYFITRMTENACKAYDVEFRTERMPFATERQLLVYEDETPELLSQLLEKGLREGPPQSVRVEPEPRHSAGNRP
jgi:hypothetical protein